MESFYDNFEGDVCELFMMYKEERRVEILEKLTRQTEERQEKLEAIALKKYEKELKQDMAKQMANADPKAKGKAAPAKGAKGGDAKPDLGVPKLVVPEVTEFTTEGGAKYLREQTMEEIAERLMKPSEEEPKESSEEEEPVEEVAPTPPPVDAKAAAKGKDAKAPSKADAKKVEEEPEEEVVEEEEVEIIPPFEANDYLEKAESTPPRDPDGTHTLHEDLIVSQARVCQILTDGLLKTLTWILAEKSNYQQKVVSEGKDLTDKSVEELDENLRKQWPRKGRLEVEVY